MPITADINKVYIMTDREIAFIILYAFYKPMGDIFKQDLMFRTGEQLYTLFGMITVDFLDTFTDQEIKSVKRYRSTLI